MNVRGYIKVGQETWKIQVSNEKNGCLGYIGDEQLPRYIGSMKNHDKESLLTNRYTVIECIFFLFRGSVGYLIEN